MDKQPQTQAKLLVVDDDPAIREVLTFMLRSIIGDIHEIHTAEDAEKAIELAKQITFDGVFTDMQMPGMDGLELFRELRKFQPGIKVVIMTGHASQDRIDAALQEGAIDCLAKPFTAADIKAILEKH